MLKNLKNNYHIRDYQKEDYIQIIPLWESLDLRRPERGDNRAIIENSIKGGGKLFILDLDDNPNTKNVIEITVSDNGVGIDQEILPKIFADDEFYSSNGTDSEKGTGLGLKLCKEFVEKHKGEIRVESELNKGSDFIFTIYWTYCSEGTNQ